MYSILDPLNCHIEKLMHFTYIRLQFLVRKLCSWVPLKTPDFYSNVLIWIQQDATLHSLFYLETALHVSGGTTTHHQERKQLYLQHLAFVTPLLLPAAIVEGLEPGWVCCGWSKPRTAHSNRFQIRNHGLRPVWIECFLNLNVNMGHTYLYM